MARPALALASVVVAVAVALLAPLASADAPPPSPPATTPPPTTPPPPTGHFQVTYQFTDSSCSNASLEVVSVNLPFLGSCLVPSHCKPSLSIGGRWIMVTCVNELPPVLDGWVMAVKQPTCSGGVQNAVQFPSGACVPDPVWGGYLTGSCNGSAWWVESLCDPGCQSQCVLAGAGKVGQENCVVDHYGLCGIPSSPPTTPPPPPSTTPLPTTSPPTSGGHFQVRYQYNDWLCQSQSLELVQAVPSAADTCTPIGACTQQGERWIQVVCTDDLPQLREGWVMEAHTVDDNCTGGLQAVTQLPIGACVPTPMGSVYGTCDGASWAVAHLCDATCAHCESYDNGTVGEAQCEDGVYGLCQPAQPTSPPWTAPPETLYTVTRQFAEPSCSESSLVMVSIEIVESGSCDSAACAELSDLPGQYTTVACVTYDQLPELRPGWFMQAHAIGSNCDAALSSATQLPIGTCVPTNGSGVVAYVNGSLWGMGKNCAVGAGQECQNCGETSGGMLGTEHCQDGRFALANQAPAPPACASPTPVYPTPLDEVWLPGGTELDTFVSPIKDCLALAGSTVLGGWTVVHDGQQVRGSPLNDGRGSTREARPYSCARSRMYGDVF